MKSRNVLIAAAVALVAVAALAFAFFPKGGTGAPGVRGPATARPVMYEFSTET